jgi:hypothetical protein
LTRHSREWSRKPNRRRSHRLCRLTAQAALLCCCAQCLVVTRLPAAAASTPRPTPHTTGPPDPVPSPRHGARSPSYRRWGACTDPKRGTEAPSSRLPMHVVRSPRRERHRHARPWIRPSPARRRRQSFDDLSGRARLDRGEGEIPPHHRHPCWSTGPPVASSSYCTCEGGR